MSVQRLTLVSAIAMAILGLPEAILAVTWPPSPQLQRAPADKAPAHSPSDFVELNTGIEFVLIPGGCFEMGDFDAGVVDTICVDEFFLGKSEITNAQYRRFRPDHDSGAFEGHSLNGEIQPVVNANWHEAMAFAHWLTERADRSFRLPTEAEWEYAARAGTTTARYWGADVEEAHKFANLMDQATSAQGPDRFYVTAPVQSFPANPAGLHDMLGNASEWVLDSYLAGAERYGGQRQNPIVYASGPLRVRRGGSWDDPAEMVRCSSRDYYVGDFGVPQTGFRLVLESE